MAYEFFGANDEFRLQKFGVPEGSKELYAEYFVHDDFFDYHNLDAAFIDLEERSLELKDSIISQEISAEFLSSHDIENVIISFYNGGLEDNVTFPYPV